MGDDVRFSVDAEYLLLSFCLYLDLISRRIVNMFLLPHLVDTKQCDTELA